jgi:uncharacterized protein with ParB-like and HNH nuclease domain
MSFGRVSNILQIVKHCVYQDTAESKQIKLIDSIFRNFYIPPVVFAVQKDDEGEEVRICVDGKQRLTSIQKFFDGHVSVTRLLSLFLQKNGLYYEH